MTRSLPVEIDNQILLLCGKLRSLQNADGGFKGYYTRDEESGVFTTGEIVTIVGRALPPSSDPWLRDACRYLLRSQNPDGGWPFRPKGKSITDVTAWSCLALAQTDSVTFGSAISSGVDFLLHARVNENGLQEPGWGLTAFEPDRIYSTYIACLAFLRIPKLAPQLLPAIQQEALATAVAEATQWLLERRRADGGWEGRNVIARNSTTTALALITLFENGADPRAFQTSYDFLRAAAKDGYWTPERDLVITREGYELTLEWFTTAYCFQAMTAFADVDVASIAEIDAAYDRLQALIRDDGCVTRLPGSSPDLVWTIALMIETLHRFRAFAVGQEAALRRHWADKAAQVRRQRQELLHDYLKKQFPYPISRLFFDQKQELDPHRRFDLTLQFYEVAVKYAAAVGLAGYLSASDQIAPIQALLTREFKRPSFGHWASLLLALMRQSPGCARLLHPLSGADILKAHRDYLDDRGPRLNLPDLLGDLVALRNEHAHGAVRSVPEYRGALKTESNRLYNLIQRMAFLASGNSFLVLRTRYDEFGEGERYTVRVFRGLDVDDSELDSPSRLSQGQEDAGVRYIYFQNMTNNTIVNLYPFTAYMFCEACKGEHFFFYNGLKGETRVDYLSYECGHAAERDNIAHFAKRLALSGITW